MRYDQLNITELSSFELLLRKAQDAEWRHRDRILASGVSDDIAEDETVTPPPSSIISSSTSR